MYGAPSVPGPGSTVILVIRRRCGKMRIIDTSLSWIPNRNVKFAVEGIQESGGPILPCSRGIIVLVKETLISCT